MSTKITASQPSELEQSIANALTDLESSVGDLRSALRPLQFHAAREIEVGKGRKAIVIFVPVPSLPAYHKIQQRLTRELEKKFSDRHIMFLAQRRIMPRPSRRHNRQTQQRPRSRTLTAVHDKMLDDLVFPTEVVGRRQRFTEGGKRIQKVFLDNKDAAAVDYKLDSFAGVYNKLTGKQVVFEIPAVQAEY